MAELFKDKFSPKFFDQFISIVKSSYSSFDEQQFLSFIYDREWEKRELKQRIRHITKGIHETFPASFHSALEILRDIAPQCRGIEYLFFPDFVEMYGLEHWEESMDALEQFTEYSSSEFAVRVFIMKDQDRMMQQMQEWSKHDNYHIRRLASEGCRPRLPWAMALTSLKKNPTPIIPILDQLKQDPSLYVRKSVANNLNDISKDHPEKVKQLVQEWSGGYPFTDWIIKHGCRGLLKKGDIESLRLFGYKEPSDISVHRLSLSSDQLSLGDTLTFSFDVRNESIQPQKLRIEYGIDYVKANGKHSRKIFQLSQKEYPTGNVQVKRKHLFKDLTTRKHYSGSHGVSILVNGEEKANAQFMLNTGIHYIEGRR
jgi:3-methyladenine DNA glycosylase AlkC